MKCTVVIDPAAEEEVLIRAKQHSTLVEDIETLVRESDTDLIGYRDGEIAPLKLAEIYCFFAEGGKIYAQTVSEKWQVKQRLYALEAMLDHRFVKINQSCIVNVRHIKCFQSSFVGGLTVTLQNGYRDYVSRRQLKSVKERMGM